MIVRKLNVRGGVQRHVLSLARELQKRGDTVALYTFVYDPEKCYTDMLAGQRIVVSGGYPARMNFLFGMIAERRAAAALALRIDPDTDVLNPHDHVCYKVAAYFKERVARAPSVWTMHDMPTKTFAYARARALDPAHHRGAVTRLAYALIDWYDRVRFIRQQDCIVVLDRRDKALARRFFGDKVAIVRNGLDIMQFPYHARSDRRNSVPRNIKLLMNGIFLPHRRFEDGIAALAILRDRGYDAELAITGAFQPEDPYYRRLASIADEYHVRDRVLFTGEITEAELVLRYQSCDAFIFPNHLQSWGLTVFEAMACGAPVIVSRSAGAAEVLTDGVTALLVPPRSPDEIASAVARLADDPLLAGAMSREGRAFVEREISWSRLGDRMHKLFSMVLKDRPAGGIACPVRKSTRNG